VPTFKYLPIVRVAPELEVLDHAIPDRLFGEKVGVRVPVPFVKVKVAVLVSVP
jgi:hypothetical protein